MKSKGGGRDLDTLLEDIRVGNPYDPYEIRVSKIKNYFSKKKINIDSKPSHFNKLENKLNKLENKLNKLNNEDDTNIDKMKKINIIRDTIYKMKNKFDVKTISLKEIIDKTDNDKLDDDIIIEFIESLYYNKNIIDEYYNDPKNSSKNIFYDNFKKIKSVNKKHRLYHNLIDKKEFPTNYGHIHALGIKNIEEHLGISKKNSVKTLVNNLQNPNHSSRNPNINTHGGTRKRKKSKKHRKSRKIKKRMTRKKRDIKKRRKSKRNKMNGGG